MFLFTALVAICHNLSLILNETGINLSAMSVIVHEKGKFYRAKMQIGDTLEGYEPGSGTVSAVSGIKISRYGKQEADFLRRIEFHRPRSS